MAILDDVKTDLRITNSSFNTELTTAIAAAKSRLSQIGVEVISDTDAVTATAIKLYCRSWMNFQGDSERYDIAFNSIASAMALSGDYKDEQ